MDPLSITATCLQVAETVYQASSAVAVFINGANSVEADLKDLLTELQALHSQINDIRFCFQNEAFVNGVQSFQRENGSTISVNLYKHLQHCVSSAEKLDRILKTITPLGNDPSFIRKGVTYFRLGTKVEELAKVRTQIQNSKTSLMLSLGVMQICKSMQSDEKDPIQTDILHAKIENIEKLLQNLGTHIEAGKERVASDDDETEILDDMEVTRLVSVKVKAVATSEVVRRASVAGTERNFMAAASIQGIPLSRERKKEVERWIPSMQASAETEETGDQSEDSPSPYNPGSSSSASKKPILLPAIPMTPPPKDPNASKIQRKQVQSRPSPSSLPKRESENSVKSSPTPKAVASISNEEFENSMAVTIQEAEARTTTPGKPYAEEDFTEISRLLSLVGKPQWSERPRTYLVLRSIGEVQAMSSVILEQLNDIHFPYTEATLPKCCLSSPGARHSFIQKQSLVFSPRPADLVLGGPHRHLGKSADIYFDVFKTLGRGGHGVVDDVRSKLSLKHYARKRINRSNAFAKKKDILKVFENEIHNLKRLNHDHLVKFVGSYTDPKYIGLIMEPVAESDLLQFLKRDTFRDEELTMLRGFLGCLSSAVVYLHSNNCRHKDLKPGNILINNGTVLITDFGIALDWTDLGQDTTTGKPEAYTNSYVAPEVAAAKPRNVAADIWSLGCVFMDITTILKDETLTSKRHFFEQNGSHSGFVWENQEALQEWLDFLQNKSQEDQEPLDWIRQMTNPDPRSRPTAEDLRQDILKAEHGTYCGHCCNDDASSDKTSWRGSDSDDEEISVTRNTTVSNAMNTPIRPPPIHLGTSAEKGKSPMSDSSFQGKPKLPRFPWQDQTTIAVPSTNTEPYAAVYVGPSEFTEDRTSSSNLSKFETQKSEPGYFDKTSEITMDVEDNLGHIPSRTSSQADSPEETFFHTHFAPRTRNNPMRAVPVSLNPAERRETALALIDKDEDPTKGDQETIKNLFKTDHEDLEDFLLELRDQGDGSWKNTLLKAVGALEKDRRGYTLLHAAANFRNYGISRDAVEAIIQRSSEVNALNIYLNSPLHYAADRDRPSIVKYMLKFGAKIDQMNIRKQTPLHIASQMGRYDATRVLARNGSSDFVNMKDDYGKTSLHYACENANLSIAEILLDNDASLDKKDENGYTPKALAWDGDDEEFQEALDEMLAERADAMTSSSTSSRSPVRLGPQPFPTGGKPPVFSRLDLSKPCKCEVCKMTTAIESIPEAEELELLKCPCKGHLRDLSRDMLSDQELLDRTLDDNDPKCCKCPKCLNSKKETDEVNRNARTRNTCGCRICREKGDYSSSINSDNTAPPGSSFDRDLPPYRGNEFFDRFIERATMGNGSPAFQAAQSRNAIKILSEAGFKGKNSYRTNPGKAMIWAMNEIATVNSLEAIVQLLLENGAPVDTVNKDKCTFLHVAARHGKLRVAHILIQKGAKTNATRNSVFALKSDWTPLKYAFWFDKPIMMRLLLRNGADINHQPDTHERTLLHEAIEEFQTRGSHIPMLLAHGASLTIKDSQGRTPFHLAVINGNLPVARALLEAGADVEAVAKPGQKALSFAIESANAEMVTFLVQNGGADVHSACDGYVCALMHAVKKADGYVLEALLNKSTASADVNRTDAQGRTCLHILANATAHDIFDLLDLLIDNGADVGIEDKTGSTPLHEAAKAGSSVMASRLLYYRADQHVQNHAGKTPLDLAKAKRYKEVVEILGGTLKKKGLFRRS